ncbi:DUF2357 domain-containing protein [Motilimonas eburnea]|uniref:DUF2357 domain-containing protein n=1 Tax=Motilimonas eburnea TaxID=1737488 RepID=UPI001E409EDE|nr:DUF2357 domain-containing protein [Motilimonas eburnea]MCE2572666.1 restriction endonuclease-like protein [Motilimonas eburnea]
MAKQSRETLHLVHYDFDLYVTAQGLDKPRQQLANTYAKRELCRPSEDIEVKIDGLPASLADQEVLTEPFFFENRQYWFEIEFKAGVEQESAAVSHKYNLIEQSFILSPRRNALQAMINFGNDIGRCEFHITYVINGERKSVPVGFNVLATKMVQSIDLKWMTQQIDQVYPLWRYAISSKTTQSQGKSNRQAEPFELFWLAQFERLVAEFNQGVKRILHAPHNRLQSFTQQQPLDRIHKKLSVKQQQQAKELITSKRASSRMGISLQRLNVNTPENRFIKMVLKRTKANLAKLITVIRSGEESKESKASDSFLQQLDTWHEQIAKHAKHQLWREVGPFEGQASESKVLQQGAGYSKVYKVWQQLKHYLNHASGEAQLSIRSVADIYEVWCFLEVKSVIESLRFELQEKKLSSLKKVQFERQFSENSMAAAFVYYRHSDGMTIELAHEPSFSPQGKDNRTWLANQRPDIVLRVTLANKESFLILFDAKYRIDSKALKNGQDGVPEDAINQMHRYRDAIIHQQHLPHEATLKSRPVMGAFALYPGFFDQPQQPNPYDEAINEIGIGAFALLPTSDQSGAHNYWLRCYLRSKLGVGSNTISYLKPPSHDYYFVEDAARIAPYGVTNVRHRGLTMVAPINEIGRDSEYLSKAQQGQLTGYHTQLIATNRQNVHRNIVREIRYLLVTVRQQLSDKHQVGQFLYRVGNVKLLPRRDIDVELTGKVSADSHYYWVFEFVGQPFALNKPIMKDYDSQHFQFKLTKAEYLQQVTHWDEIADKYEVYSDIG